MHWHACVGPALVATRGHRNCRSYAPCADANAGDIGPRAGLHRSCGPLNKRLRAAAALRYKDFSASRNCTKQQPPCPPAFNLELQRVPLNLAAQVLPFVDSQVPDRVGERVRRPATMYVLVGACDCVVRILAADEPLAVETLTSALAAQPLR